MNMQNLNEHSLFIPEKLQISFNLFIYSNILVLSQDVCND